MHGRLKVKTTAEQAEARRLERLKKQKLYQGACAKAHAKRAAGDYDLEGLKLTQAILSGNPDELTIWNYRKEILIELTDSCSPEEISVHYADELAFLEECLQYNPKSYSSWQQRCFVMLHTPTPDWKRELDLCTKFLTYDERNFHCWDYRRFVVKHSNVPPEDELEFSTGKISTNFSNYSSWHYRSKLLPHIYPGETNHSSGLQQSILLEEMELVQNAFFTDPSDQSAWFYHRWLLGRAENPLELLNVDRNKHNNLVLSFSMPVEILQPSGGETGDVPLVWVSPDGNSYSTTWYSRGSDTPVTISVQCKMQQYKFNLEDRRQTDKRTMEKYFTHEMSAATTETLTQELDNCEQLYELESDNKWVLLTIALLMRRVHPVTHRQSITDHLHKLTEVDPMRKNYYHDLRSRFLWEDAVGSLSTTEINLSNQAMTTIYHIHLMYAITRLDISNNKLRNLTGVNSLQKLEYINAANNCIVSVKGLQNMPNLVKLHLENNEIRCTEEIEAIKKTCSAAIDVKISGNPCTES